MKVTEPEDSRPYARLYKATIDEAVGGSAALMHRLVAHVRTELREREAQARERRERDRVTHSRRLINQHESALCERFREELQTAFNRQSSAEYAQPAPQALHFKQVGALDDAQLQDQVETARVQRSVQDATTGALDELSRLICILLGQPEVRLERNPLRPAVYVEAITAALSHLPVAPAMRLAWIGMMSRALGHELDLYYRTLCEELRERGVGAAGGVAAEPTQPARRTAPTALDDRAVVVTLEKLRRLLARPDGQRAAALAERFDLAPSDASATLDPQQAEPVAAGFEATVPAALEALRDMRQVDEVVERVQSGRGAAAGMSGAELLAEVRAAAVGPDQALAVEVVALMVDNIRRDPRLLQPVQDLIAELEPALLRLALVDPRFFSHRQHPARRLLHEIAHRSVAYESQDSRGFSGFMAPLREVVAPLARSPIATAEPFDHALQRMVALLDDPHGQDQRRIERAVGLLQQAEQRSVLAETIVADVCERARLEPIPGLVLDFLCGPWAQVVAQARITDVSGADDPGQYAQAIDELLATCRERKPAPAQLLERLHAGLATIGYPQERAQALHAWLADPQAPAEAVAPSPADPPKAYDSLWVAPTEAQASGFVDAIDAARVPAASAGLPELAVGTWVTLFAEGQWSRTRLGWASPGGTLLMFTDALGFMHSFSRRACEQMMADGHLRVLSADPVEDALDAVAQAALSNSVDIPV